MSPTASPGLCERCAHHGVQRSARDSVFHRCLRADSDPRFPRYPPMPVMACGGFEPDDASDEGERGEA